jgi:hypothetical protein
MEGLLEVNDDDCRTEKAETVDTSRQHTNTATTTAKIVIFGDVIIVKNSEILVYAEVCVILVLIKAIVFLSFAGCVGLVSSLPFQQPST